MILNDTEMEFRECCTWHPSGTWRENHAFSRVGPKGDPQCWTFSWSVVQISKHCRLLSVSGYVLQLTRISDSDNRCYSSQYQYNDETPVIYCRFTVWQIYPPGDVLIAPYVFSDSPAAWIPICILATVSCDLKYKYFSYKKRRDFLGKHRADIRCVLESMLNQCYYYEYYYDHSARNLNYRYTL